MKQILLLAALLPLLHACAKKIEQPAPAEEITTTLVDPLIWPCWNNIWQDRGEVNIYFNDHPDAAIGVGNMGYFLREWQGTYKVWEYNISNKTWTDKGVFPGLSRVEGTIVMVGSKIYFGLGIRFESATAFHMHDWWEYDPAANQWQQKADFPAVSRTSATAFAAASKAYVVGGYDREVTDGYLKETWQYDPVLDAWEQKANFPGAKRDKAAGFGIGDKGYVGTGEGRILVLNNPVTIYFKDFYEYNALTNTWAQKADLPGATKRGAFSFMIRGNGFIGGGYNASAGYRELYMFDHVNNLWVQKADYPGYGFAPHHFGRRLHFSSLDHGYVFQDSYLTRDGIIPQTMWRYIKRQYCPN